MSANPVPPPAEAVRPHSFAAFHQQPPAVGQPARHWRMRAQNFFVEWIEADAAGHAVDVQSGFELLVILPDSGAQIAPRDAADAPAVQAARRSLCILPAGGYRITAQGPGRMLVLASERPDLDAAGYLNAAAYAEPDRRIAPTGHPYRRTRNTGQVVIHDIDAFQAPADNPRLKMLQTDTLSINWVEYDGPRTRTALSPHSHASFEQGTLAMDGNYVHHLRVPWGKNADLWRDDEHVQAPSPSLLVIPVNLTHTTEGVGEGHHLLLDIFSPPRADFIAKGWVHNAGDYTPTTG